MVDDIASDSDSTSTTNNSEASEKCASPLVVPENAFARMLQKFEHRLSEHCARVVSEHGARVDAMINDEERWKIC